MAWHNHFFRSLLEFPRDFRGAERPNRQGDWKFESGFLQQPVCLSGELRVCRRKAPHFGGGLRAAGDVRTYVLAANWDYFAVSL
jgi:hypothetical protein